MERNRNLLGIAITFTVAYLALLLISGCKTKYVSVPEYHKEYISRTDSFFRTDTIREKEWMTIKEVDSTQLAELGIQLRNIKTAYLIERNRNRERNNVTTSIKTDTIFKADSVSVPYPVERKLSRWERVKMDYGGMAIGGTFVAVCFIVAWLARRFRLV